MLLTGREDLARTDFKIEVTSSLGSIEMFISIEESNKSTKFLPVIIIWLVVTCGLSMRFPHCSAFLKYL